MFHRFPDVATGTFSILHLNTTIPTQASTSQTTSSLMSLSLFNISEPIQAPYFNIHEITRLFNEFERDNDIHIDEAVVSDVLTKSNGCVSCLNLSIFMAYILQPSVHGMPL
jgi:hypothetical protein